MSTTAWSTPRSARWPARPAGSLPTRLVALVDGLEERGLVERRRNPRDRRLYAVHLTERGGALMADIARVAAEHDATVLAALSPDERATLHALLSRVAADRGLTPGVHPGYRTLRAPDGTTGSAERGHRGEAAR